MSLDNINLLGPDVGYTDLLNHSTSEAMEGGNGWEGHPLRPSASGDCTRELAYKYSEYMKLASYEKKADSPESHRLLNLGGWIERHLIGMFEKYFKLFKVRYKQQIVEFYKLESKINPNVFNHLVEGSIDLCFWSPKYKVVVDIKSKKDRFSAAYASNWDETTEKLDGMASVERISDTAFWVNDLPAFLEELNDAFFASNFLQLNGYASTEFLKTRGVDHAAIIQYNKNDSRIREVRFRPSEKIFNQVKAKFQTAMDAVASGDPASAPRDHNLGSIKCAYCSYATACWSNKDSLIEFYNRFPKKEVAVRLSPEDEVATMVANYEAEVAHVDAAERTQDAITKLLVDRGIRKIKMADTGHIYEVKFYKTDNMFKLKRSKY